MEDFGRFRCSIGISTSHLECLAEDTWENAIATDIRAQLANVLDTQPEVVAERGASDDEVIEFSIGISGVSPADHQTIRAALSEAGIDVSDDEGDLLEDYVDGDEWRNNAYDADWENTPEGTGDDPFFAT
ncbi:hypothetical protein FJZ27_02725 [Candidatus Peribacteria bacterium]|nr:hypothetical protein [Candidatus Peribacteria bacterium]